MRLILTVLISICFTFVLAGCSKDKGIKAPDNFSASPTDQAKDSVKAPKVPLPPGN